ncbi:MAG: class IIb bacteriocin, lactobin A/cerein 7B family [Gammaproteobacteria bacterium]|nr:class IIb bacteriocin, lactobin A/cerein 7B family [Gammaproteobacteria bacterium]MBU1464783.1 class IIb bacteriocin, lactobin A/cerein 7B family [Gammaproteobacteria bacterium]MBU2022526.1 class IIb bacteriocin, lactobin A/cerein 7B family [Gammaproteobacteria bacterium]MBU2238490.1 class IIb bacteriocin, lactobin A/cerein 7B family [Gammaproteobacteria bacterium]MBU2319643.1 class IIb bacteriocin, lactobin A/cerein 7B family [Gammaproteobacteria bacterium]
MREISIEELDVVSGGVAPIVAAIGVVAVKATAGATAGAAGYLTVNSIQGNQPTVQGATTAAVVGGTAALVGPLSPHILRTTVLSSIAGGAAGNAVDGSDYCSDGTNYN